MDRTPARVEPPVPFEWELDGGRDQIVVLQNISWDQYVALNDARDSKQPLFAYLDGELELVTVSIRHEFVKTLIARLVEAFAEETGAKLNGFGGATLRKKAKRAGCEPDEWYCVGKPKQTPDLAMEVVHTSGGINKLEVYRRLGVLIERHVGACARRLGVSLDEGARAGQSGKELHEKYFQARRRTHGGGPPRTLVRGA